MKRTLLSFLVGGLVAILPMHGLAFADTKGTVTYNFEIKAEPDAKKVQLWAPYPLSEASQKISNVKISGNYKTSKVVKDDATGASYVYAAWENAKEAPKMTMSFHVDSHFRKGHALKDNGAKYPADVKKYLAASPNIPSDNKKILTIAEDAVEGATTNLAKARAIYEWTIANTFRDPDVKGCGLGKALATLNEAKGGGKCADISSVFVTVMRAAGIPTRDVFGLRSTGKDGEITGDFHCWTEFYLPGTGWVQADPADVRKAMLIEKLDLDSPKTKEWTEFFWNGDNLFRIIMSRSDRGITFKPAQAGGPVDYFMYPFAQVDGKTLDFFDPKNFKYTVTFKAD